MTAEDQDIVWQMLMHAAHENDIQVVQSNSQLKTYAQNFGHQKGDVGIGAFLVETEKSTTASATAVGAAWVRVIPGGGYATSHLHKGHPLQALPELAIACLPDYRGEGIGSELLKRLIQVVRQEQQIQQPGDGIKYPGICLSCRADNDAMRLYERIGFVEVPGADQTNRVGGTSITMSLKF